MRHPKSATPILENSPVKFTTNSCTTGVHSLKESQNAGASCQRYNSTSNSISTTKRDRSGKRTILRRVMDSDFAPRCHIFTIILGVFFLFFPFDGRLLPGVVASSVQPTLSEVVKENERTNSSLMGTGLRENEKPGKATQRKENDQLRPFISANAQGKETAVVAMNKQSSIDREVNTFHERESMSTRTTKFETRQSPISETGLTKKPKRPKTTPWIECFLSIHRLDALLSIPRDFLEDNFNLYNISQLVEESLKPLFDEYQGKEENEDRSTTYTSSTKTTFRPTSSYFTTIYRAALKKILGDDELDMFQFTIDVPQLTALLVEKAAEIIYLYAHARFVSSQRGLDLVHKMLLSGEPLFGRCPRTTCQGMRLLPYGKSEFYCSDSDACSKGNFLSSTAMRYCCCCGEVFVLNWRGKNDECAVDGCAWGPSFCHLYLMTHGNDFDPRLLHTARQPSIDDGYILRDECCENLHYQKRDETAMPTPAIFGFKLHPSAPIRYPILVWKHK